MKLVMVFTFLFSSAHWIKSSSALVLHLTKPAFLPPGGRLKPISIFSFADQLTLYPNIGGVHWSLLCFQKKFHSNCMIFCVTGLISKADHHVQQFEFCGEIFLYMSWFFHFQARYLLLFLSVEGSQYLRPLQFHHECQQDLFLVKHAIFALILNTM